MHTKQTKDSKLTRVQEQTLFALWMLEGNLYGREGGDYIPQYYAGKAIALVLGGQWSSYRTNLLKRLIKSGWAEVKKVGHLKYYRLSYEGYVWVQNLLFDARNGRTFETRKQAF